MTREKPDWSSHGWPMIIQDSRGGWWGVKKGWTVITEINRDGSEHRHPHLSAKFLKHGKLNGDWMETLENRP